MSINAIEIRDDMKRITSLANSIPVTGEQNMQRMLEIINTSNKLSYIFDEFILSAESKTPTED